MVKIWRIKAECHKCGGFEVVRRHIVCRSTSGKMIDRPRNVVCPKCRMWADEIIECAEETR